MSEAATEYRTIDKSGWPFAGPWTDEPDKRQWTDAATGLPCLIVRGGGGALCGYVGVAEGHPAFGVDYDDVYKLAEIEVHGGLTYADRCREGPEASAICHVPAPGASDAVWWLGFDCGHYGDFVPEYAIGGGPHEYKRIAWVAAQCARLAQQLAAVGAAGGQRDV